MNVIAAAAPRPDALRAAAAGPIEGFDVSDPALYQHEAWGPYFARLRREDPVHFCPESRFGPKSHPFQGLLALASARTRAVATWARATAPST